MNTQKGFTIIELLMAMAIALVLLAGTTQLFSSNTRAFRLIDQMKVMEENGRIGMDIMVRDVRGASTGKDGRPVYLWDNTAENNDPAQTGGSIDRSALNALPGTDVIEVFISQCSEAIYIPSFNENSASAPQLPADVVASCLPCYTTGDSNQILAECVSQFNIRMHKVGSDYHCQNHITQGNKQGTDRINLGWNRGVNIDHANRPHQCDDGEPGNQWDAEALIGADVYYYVQAGSVDRPTQLIRYQVGGTPEAVANHVEDFQVLSGEDNNTPRDKDIDTWTDGIVNGANVVSLKLSILLKAPSIDKEKQEETPPTLENSGITSLGTPDKYRRRVMTRTVRLRNMN